MQEKAKQKGSVIVVVLLKKLKKKLFRYTKKRQVVSSDMLLVVIVILCRHFDAKIITKTKTRKQHTHNQPPLTPHPTN